MAWPLSNDGLLSLDGFAVAFLTISGLASGEPVDRSAQQVEVNVGPCGHLCQDPSGRGRVRVSVGQGSDSVAALGQAPGPVVAGEPGRSVDVLDVDLGRQSLGPSHIRWPAGVSITSVPTRTSPADECPIQNPTVSAGQAGSNAGLPPAVS